MLKASFSDAEVKESRKKALQEIVAILDKGNIEDQFKDRSGEYHSKDKFIVSWKGMYKMMCAEYSICKTDHFYASYSGYKAIYTTQGLFHQHQFKGYDSIERALIIVGMQLCGNRKEKESFFTQFAIPYNKKIKDEKI